MPLLFVFDMDDVLYRYDWRVRMAELAAATGHDVHELRRRWWLDPRGESLAEAGGWTTGDEYLAAANAAFGSDISRTDWLRMRAAAMTARPAALAAVRRAAELGRVSLLTNNGILVHEHLAELAPELAEIIPADDLRASAYYGARKPDPAVFRAVLADYDADSRDVFFADDLVENVRGAESVGITAHLYRDEAGLLAAIEDFAARRSAAA